MTGASGPTFRLMKSLLMAVVSILLLAWDAAPDPIVDGWPIREPMSCVPEERCAELLELAARRLDRRDQDRAAVVEAVMHYEGMILDDHGSWLNTHTGRVYVARFELADGSVRAIGVGFPGVSDTPIAYDYGYR
jgi:hypothetical protein